MRPALTNAPHQISDCLVRHASQRANARASPLLFSTSFSISGVVHPRRLHSSTDEPTASVNVARKAAGEAIVLYTDLGGDVSRNDTSPSRPEAHLTSH